MHASEKGASLTLKESVVEFLKPKSRIEHLSVSLGNESRLDFYRSLVSLTTYFFLRKSQTKTDFFPGRIS